MRRADPGHIRFRDDTLAAYSPPRNTTDDRWQACIKHHPACDCREAEFNEELRECQGELQALRDAIGEILAGHPASDYETTGSTGCMCTGCQIARRVHLAHIPGYQAARTALSTPGAPADV